MRATDAAFQAEIAEVREAGLNIMMSMKGDGKPVSFIEDCAVDLDDLADFTDAAQRRVRAARHEGDLVRARLGRLPACPSGAEHERPRRRRDDARDRGGMLLRWCANTRAAIAASTATASCAASSTSRCSARASSRAFEAVKDAFDPAGLLNPNRIVRPPRMDDRTLFRYPPGYAAAPGFTPKLDWSAYPGPLGGMLGAVEMCNNNGTCRKFDAGAMCPSYRATRDEMHLTRGRANTLRLALTGQLGADAMASDAVAEAMKLCVSCKACRRECPTGVDMASMKIEVLAARADRHGVRARERLIAELPRLGAPRRRASRGSPISRGRLARTSSASPPSAAATLAFARRFATTRRTRRGDVLLLRRHVQPLFRAGKPARRGARPARRRPACRACRAPAAARCAAAGPISRPGWWTARAPKRGAALAALAGDAADHRAGTVLPADAARRVAIAAAGRRDRARSPIARVLIGEFLARKHSRRCASRARGDRACPRPLPPEELRRVSRRALDALRRVPGLDVRPIASSCCGMAGAFGYQAETQDVSRAMAEAGLLPAVRAAAPKTTSSSPTGPPAGIRSAISAGARRCTPSASWRARYDAEDVLNSGSRAIRASGAKNIGSKPIRRSTRRSPSASG